MIPILISHRHKFIYTKTIKTAGTSVESFFERFCMPENEWEQLHYRPAHISSAGIVGYRGEDISQQQWFNHMPAELIRDKIGTSVWEEYFKFCVIRNPYEKAVSAFYFYKLKGNLGVESQNLNDAELFLRWLKVSGPPDDRCCYMINDKICLDFFIRYESLEKDILKVCNLIGLDSCNVVLPKYKSEFRPVDASAKKMYCSEAIDIIKNYYSFELDYFDYAFPL